MRLMLAAEGIAFIFCVGATILWILDPSGPYAPYFTASTLIFIATDVARRYEGKVFKFEGVVRTPSERVHHREKLRKEFEEEIYRCRRDNLRKDVIIRHVNRLDQYPDVKDEKGISPWFKLGLLDTYHGGIKVALRWVELVAEGDYLRVPDFTSGERGDVKAVLMGNIPYDFIESINVGGDEYYYLPHIYCHYAHKGEPYERLYYAQKVDMGHGHTFWREIASYDDVEKRSKRKRWLTRLTST